MSAVRRARCLASCRSAWSSPAVGRAVPTRRARSPSSSRRSSARRAGRDRLRDERRRDQRRGRRGGRRRCRRPSRRRRSSSTGARPQGQRDPAGDRRRDRRSGCCGWRARCSSCPGCAPRRCWTRRRWRASWRAGSTGTRCTPTSPARLMHAVCVVATSVERGVPVGFVESAAAPPRSRPRDRVRPHAAGGPARARVGGDPAALPAGRGDRAAGRGRPLRRRRDAAERADRARAGARRGEGDRRRLRAVRGRAPAGAGDGVPRLADVAANALDGLLLDQVAHDVRRMLAVNAFFAEHPSTGTSRAARAYREAQGRPPYRRISYALVAPTAAARSARWPSGPSRSATAGCAACAHPTSRCSPGCSAAPRAAARGELLSFIFFDEVFIERLLELGRARRRALARRAPRLLVRRRRRGRLRGARRSAEAVALDEFRLRRRH